MTYPHGEPGAVLTLIEEELERKRAMEVKDYRCMVCNAEIDETEFSDPRDAEVCGYCFAAKYNEVQRRRGNDFASGLNQCGRNREVAMQADIELHLEQAKQHGPIQVVAAYEHMLRVILA